jgi:hypothetical protein
MTNYYSGQSVAFLTQHGKEGLIGPMLQDALGCSILHTTAYDTDLLGTFSGEINRQDTQVQTARIKARKGMDLTGARIGIASEGAFIPDPFSGLIPWNVEILMWIDDVNNIEVIGTAQGPAYSLHRSLSSVLELEKFAQVSGFPEHHLMVRPQNQDDARVRKGLSNSTELMQAFEECKQESNNQIVFVENDLRAFCNPTRQAMIRSAADNLLEKLLSYCPACNMPGFSATRHSSGLPCRICGNPTKSAKTYTWCCTVCAFELIKPNSSLLAEPSGCDVCNP